MYGVINNKTNFALHVMLIGLTKTGSILNVVLTSVGILNFQCVFYTPTPETAMIVCCLQTTPFRSMFGPSHFFCQHNISMLSKTPTGMDIFIFPVKKKTRSTFIIVVLDYLSKKKKKIFFPNHLPQEITGGVSATQEQNISLFCTKVFPFLSRSYYISKESKNAPKL